MNFLKPLTDIFKPKVKTLAKIEEDIPLEEIEEVKPKHNYKLTEDQKAQCVILYAKGYTVTEILNELKTQYEVSVSKQQIHCYIHATKWQTIYNEARAKYLEDMAAVPGSHKKIRMSRAERQYENATKKGDVNSAIKVLEYQRSEMEEKGGISHLVLNQYNLMSDKEIEEQRNRVLERIKQLESPKVVDITPKES